MHISYIWGLPGHKGSHAARIWEEGGSFKPFTRSREHLFCTELLRDSREHREGMGHSRPCGSCTLRKHSKLERRHGGSPHSPKVASRRTSHLSLAGYLPVTLKSPRMLR